MRLIDKVTLRCVKVWPLIGAILVTAVLLLVAIHRIHVDTDITRFLPGNNPVISDALDIFINHPIHDNLAIDVGFDDVDLAALVECGDWLMERLAASGLFATVGMKEIGDAVPDLMLHVVHHLPFLFSERELEQDVKPLLANDGIRHRVEQIHGKLLNMDGVGQGEFISRDPLELKNIILGKLAHLIPAQGAQIYKGHLLSQDQRHLLVTANPKVSSTDTGFARKAAELIDQLSEELEARQGASGRKVRLTPVGAYRAALDNELMIRRDVAYATTLATVGIALLLFLSFPRPLMGLLSLAPAVVGTSVAFFVYSLWHESISVMVLGFGGAVVSITVDHSITYLLFLDRPYETRGEDAAHEVWAVGQIPVLTTIGAFGALCFSGFPVLEQLGEFTVLGFVFSLVFVHVILPKVFPVMPAASHRGAPLQPLVDKCAKMGTKGAWGAAVFVVGMLFFAKPEFHVKLSSMNTVSKDTTAAEAAFTEIWGGMTNKVFVLSEVAGIKELQRKGDRLLETVEQDIRSGVVAAAFVPSMVFPGEERRKQNLAAWMKFWDQARIEAVQGALQKAALEFGFTQDAFDLFYRMVSQPALETDDMDIPENYFNLLGIWENKAGGGLLQFSSLTVAAGYDAEGLFKKYKTIGKVFDPNFFAATLGALLFATFEKMLVVVGLSVVVLLFIFFGDWKIPLICLIPILAAFICTLGTLNLMGHPLDIPVLMLSVILLGMGVDYSVLIARSYQRYGEPSHPSFGLVRMTIFLAVASTLIGFGSLCAAQHTLLRSAGLTSFLGIGYSFLGTFLFLPPIFERLFRKQEERIAKLPHHKDRVLQRYENLEPYPRFFARFKMMLDPMFKELPEYLAYCSNVKTIIDIGTGYGVPAAWCLERYQGARLYAIEPDRSRVAVASRVVGARGTVQQGWAPDIPSVPASADLVLMLDMLHYLDDHALDDTLQRLSASLHQAGRLIIRTGMEPKTHPSLTWRVEALKLKWARTPAYYRSAEQIESMIAQVGFVVEAASESRFNRELFWFVAKKSDQPSVESERLVQEV